MKGRFILGVVAVACTFGIWANHRADLVFRTQPQRRSEVEGWIKDKEAMIVGDDESAVRRTYGEPAEIFFWIEVDGHLGHFVARQIRCGSSTLDEKRQAELLALLNRRSKNGMVDSLDAFAGLNGLPAHQVRDLLEQVRGDDFKQRMVWRYPNEKGSGLDFDFERGKVVAIRFFE